MADLAAGSRRSILTQAPVGDPAIADTLKDNRSPIKDWPYRNAGQSLEEERRDLILDKVVVGLVFALVHVVWAGLERLCFFLRRTRPLRRRRAAA